MDIKFLNQPRDIKLIDILSEKLKSKDFNKVWIIAGFAKDSAMDCVLEDLTIARNNGVAIECVFGLDKKNTSKDMLTKFLDIGCNIRFHLNDEGTKLESRLYAFESNTKTSYVYITGGKFSEGGISTNLSIIEEISYSPDEKVEFGKVKATIENGISQDEFEVLTYEKLKELASTGDIVARITERKIPSIGELYNTNQQVAVQSLEYDEGSSTEFKELLNKDVNIDIDVDDTEITVQTSLGEEVEHKLKKETKAKEEKVVSKIIPGEKEADFESMSTLLFHVGKQSGGKDEIKISSGITSNMFKFFDYPDLFHTEEDEKGNIKEVQSIKLEIYENNNKTQVVDENAKFIQTAKHTTIKSNEFLNIQLEEDDIVRLIKNEQSNFRCEIIKNNSNEHEIWEGFITSTCKGSTKKFGAI